MGRIQNCASAAVFTVVFAAVAGTAALGQSFDLNWYTMDGGGAMWTIGGEYGLSGTIGQVDASLAMTDASGAYSLTGGFWSPCAGFVPGDANCDGAVNALDIDPFILALTQPALYDTMLPECDLICNNDINGDGDVNPLDIDPFIVLLTGG